MTHASDTPRTLEWAIAVVEMDNEPDNIGIAAHVLLRALATAPNEAPPMQGSREDMQDWMQDAALRLEDLKRALATARADALEEAARICEAEYVKMTRAGTLQLATGAACCSHAIRAAKEKAPLDGTTKP